MSIPEGSPEERMTVQTRAYNTEYWQRCCERQHEQIQRLNRALEGATRGAEKQRQRDHHEMVKLFVQHRLDKMGPATGGEIAEWAHLMADYVYPPPGKVFQKTGEAPRIPNPLPPEKP